MKKYLFNNIVVIVSLIGIFIFHSGCDNRNKWKVAPFKIKRQESYNYSEMISGKLDSAAKAELEQVRKNISEENKDLSKQLDEALSENKPHFFKTILESMKNIYNWFINLF